MDGHFDLDTHDLHPIVPKPLASDLWDLQGVVCQSVDKDVFQLVTTHILPDRLLEFAIKIVPRFARSPIKSILMHFGRCIASRDARDSSCILVTIRALVGIQHCSGPIMLIYIGKGCRIGDPFDIRFVAFIVVEEHAC